MHKGVINKIRSIIIFRINYSFITKIIHFFIYDSFKFSRPTKYFILYLIAILLNIMIKIYIFLKRNAIKIWQEIGY